MFPKISYGLNHHEYKNETKYSSFKHTILMVTCQLLRQKGHSKLDD